MKTGADHIESLRDGRTVYLHGQVVEDVVEHPAYRNAVRSAAHLYDFQAAPENLERMTFASPTSGVRVNRCWQLPHSYEELVQRREALTAWAEQTVEDIFILRADGSSREPANLTRNDYKDRGPTWYPNTDHGLWLTFFSNMRGSDYQIYAIRPNGTGLHALSEDIQHMAPRWFPDGRRLRTSAGFIDFSDGPSQDLEPMGAIPLRGRHPVLPNASWSRDGKLIAQTPATRAVRGVLDVFSQVRTRTSVHHNVRDADNVHYHVAGQAGNRWLDEHRFIFWDSDIGNAFLWDTEFQTASRIEGIDELGEFRYSRDGQEFVFSEDGRTLYRVRTEVDSDIWLLEMSK